VKKLLAAAAILMVAMSLAWSGEDEGYIETVDPETNTITLDNGNTYALPDGFDPTLVGPGMRIALAYDEVEGRMKITGMQQVD
jgi:Protein of unknown function (DUF1344)